jgi:hypothetical protein
MQLYFDVVSVNQDYKNQRCIRVGGFDKKRWRCYRIVDRLNLAFRKRALSTLEKLAMIAQVIHCPYCQGINLVKNGKTPQGKQRYQCRETVCLGRTFI